MKQIKTLIPFLIALLLFALMLLGNPFSLSPAADKVLAIATLMITLWGF